ncbi:MAG: hypothetical protein N4A41_13600 [Crocinitomicaceae bacterium]|jgi:hypothetical protein|nr:hypothetical protein [Crocinitomicaceae bacterium]
MKRIQLFEFEDFYWFPSWMRIPMTNLIVVLHKLMGTKQVIGNLFLKIQKTHPFHEVVDLGSGSGGIMPTVVNEWNEEMENKVHLTLTDLHPNHQFIALNEKSNNPYVSYSKESVDATKMGQSPKGLKTMINSFHHMPPDVAKQILLSAQEEKTPLLIYEIAENKIPTLVWWLFLPLGLVINFLSALLLTPFSRPLSFSQLFFTYIIPIIPLAYAWDGQASMPRMYAYEDLDEMLFNTEQTSYHWEIAPGKKKNGKTVGYYILGLPK